MASRALDNQSQEILNLVIAMAAPLNWVVSSERELASRTAFSRSTIWNRLHRLEDTGYLQIERVPGLRTKFTVLS